MYLPFMLFIHSSTHFGSVPIFMSLWFPFLHMSSVTTPVNFWAAEAENARAADAIKIAICFFIGILPFVINGPNQSVYEYCGGWNVIPELSRFYKAQAC